MANNRIKVAGYAKKIVYDGGIEYRNFSDSLVGNQFTSDGGTTLFTAANFRITTNLDPKISKIFNTNSFGEFINLDDLKLTHDDAVILIDINSKVKLKLDKSDLTSYAYFGSLREYIRVSLEYIIMNWPASIFVSPLNEFNPALTGPTYENYNVDVINGTSIFSVSSNRFINKYNVNYLQNGEVLNNFSDTNDLRNMAINYNSYNVSSISGDFPIIGFTGATEINNQIFVQVSGDPFTNSATTVNYHIKPNDLKIEEFFKTLNDFEANLLNRLTLPIYTSNYQYTVDTELGNIIMSDMTLTWPVSDGYNIDFDSETYIDFVNNLLTIADNNDLTKTNLMTRFLTSESISEFDTIDQKMGNTLRIYGREFDEIKKFIDGLAYSNTVTYDGINNTPDIIVKNLAKVMGWDLMSSLTDVNFINNYLTTGDNTFEGYSRGLTPSEAETELWRRIILNTPWLWKSKGTRKAIEFIFKFIGSPDGLVNFNEFVYVANKSLDMGLFTQILEANTGNDDIDGLNIDSNGYPLILPNTVDMYFQKAGLWYRETGGVNSNVDISIGNNPHIGPYDGGQEYMNQFSCLIPSFQPVTLIEEVVITGSTNLFNNYNGGTFNGILDNDIILNIDADLDFTNIITKQLQNCINGLQIVPELSDCSGTTSWNITAKLDGVGIYSSSFGDYVIIEDGVPVDAYSLTGPYILKIKEIYNLLNTNYHPLLLSESGTSLTFIEILTDCDGESYYNGKNLVIDLCLNINYECEGGDCEAGSLIVSSIDSNTYQVYFSNVANNIVPSAECCTNLGYTASAITGGYNCYSTPPTITNNTNIYAYFDTTSMSISDARAAYNALNIWFNTLPEMYPSYSGNLYTIPINDEKWLGNTTRPWTGNLSGLQNNATWGPLVKLPPPGGGDTDVIVLGFIDETNPEYHGGHVPQGFTNPLQPTPAFRDDYGRFMNTLPNYNFFKCLLYPIVRSVGLEGGALVIQILASLEGRIIPSGELPQTNVDVSILTTQNPYINATYSGGTMVGLKNFGFQGRYDKQPPAENVFNSQTFADDLNNFINNV